MENVTRVCLHFITAECMQQQGEDSCTAQLLAQLAAAPADSGWTPQATAAVIVGGALAV
jgi:hypothetical protein